MAAAPCSLGLLAEEGSLSPLKTVRNLLFPEGTLPALPGTPPSPNLERAPKGYGSMVPLRGYGSTPGATSSGLHLSPTELPGTLTLAMSCRESVWGQQTLLKRLQNQLKGSFVGSHEKTPPGIPRGPNVPHGVNCGKAL